MTNNCIKVCNAIGLTFSRIFPSLTKIKYSLQHVCIVCIIIVIVKEGIATHPHIEYTNTYNHT